MAREMEITPNALRIQIHKIRRELDDCVVLCVCNNGVL